MINPSAPVKLTGLSQPEAVERLKQEGYNELPSSKRRTLCDLARETFREPIFLLLVACGAIYLFLGDAQEALILLGFVFLIVGINLYQEQKTERSLEALRDLSSPISYPRRRTPAHCWKRSGAGRFAGAIRGRSHSCRCCPVVVDPSDRR
jgi:magnesium-transporting ATPase (P-type)